MEGVSATVYRGIKRYLRRKDYERLNGGRKRKARAADLADGSSRRRRFWRIKLTPRLKLRLRFSPKKLLLRLRDGYVQMMMKLAGYGGHGVSDFGMRPVKEYDERVVVEIYRSVVKAQGQVVARDAAWIASQNHVPTVTPIDARLFVDK